MKEQNELMEVVANLAKDIDYLQIKSGAKKFALRKECDLILKGKQLAPDKILSVLEGNRSEKSEEYIEQLNKFKTQNVNKKNSKEKKPLGNSPYETEDELEYHEYANLLPMMSDDEQKVLQEDIEENGQQEAIILYEGKILDGRNRYEACRKLNKPALVVEYAGSSSPCSFVLSKNIARRHLSSSQRAAVAVISLPELEKEAEERMKKGYPKEKIPEGQKGQSRDIAARLAGVNSHYVSDVKKIFTEDEKLFRKILNGEATLSQAKKKLKSKEETENSLSMGDVLSQVVEALDDSQAEKLNEIAPKCKGQTQKILKSRINKLITKPIIKKSKEIRESK